MGQKRKSVTATRMSGVGGKAEVDFGRPEVCFQPEGDIGRLSIDTAFRHLDAGGGSRPLHQ